MLKYISKRPYSPDFIAGIGPRQTKVVIPAGTEIFIDPEGEPIEYYCEHPNFPGDVLSFGISKHSISEFFEEVK